MLFTSRAPIGYVCVAETDLCTNQGFKSLICNPALLHNEFAYYLLLSKTKEIENIANWATFKEVSWTTLGNFEITIPNIDEQRKIASFLSIYDDLIENNSRRIKVLESMAEELYKEWFVRFRFPGHESVGMVDSGTEFGFIPEGWEVKPVWECVETIGGGTPSTGNEAYWNEGIINWYSPVDLTKAWTLFAFQSGQQINELALQKSSARLFPAYSVMLTSRATIGVISINVTPACTNQGFITCIPNEKFSAYQIYFWLRRNKESILSLAGWATFKEITKSTFRKIPILSAPERVNLEFVRVMEPIFKEIELIEQRTNGLRHARDLIMKELL